MIKDIDIKIYNFIRHKKWSKLFNKNLYNYRGIKLKKFIQELYEDSPKSLAGIINQAFIWIDTDEGYDFWNKIDTEVNTYVYNLIEN